MKSCVYICSWSSKSIKCVYVCECVCVCVCVVCVAMRYCVNAYKETIHAHRSTWSTNLSFTSTYFTIWKTSRLDTLTFCQRISPASISQTTGVECKNGSAVPQARVTWNSPDGIVFSLFEARLKRRCTWIFRKIRWITVNNCKQEKYSIRII